MVITHTTRPFICQIALLSACCMLFCGCGTAQVIKATIGDSIPLNGTVQLADTVYLFVTGPGMPTNGARMENSNAPVVTGNPETFTQVMVVNERWAYTWNTDRVSGGLAPGSYTVYISTQPVAADALAGTKYADIGILLSRPVTTGTIVVQSEPRGATISLNGKYAGDTPRTLEGLSPGDYLVGLEKEGYLPAEGTVTLAAGDSIRFGRTLVPAVITEIPSPPLTAPTFTEAVTPLPTPTTSPLDVLFVIITTAGGTFLLARRT